MKSLKKSKVQEIFKKYPNAQKTQAGNECICRYIIVNEYLCYTRYNKIETENEQLVNLRKS
jgi:hypothetical protein